MDHARMRFIVKLYAFIAFSVLCLIAVAGNISYAFLYPNIRGAMDLGTTVTVISLYIGVFKLILPTKAEAISASSLSPNSSYLRFNPSPTSLSSGSAPSTPSRPDGSPGV
jgi:hypothetical protein